MPFIASSRDSLDFPADAQETVEDVPLINVLEEEEEEEEEEKEKKKEDCSSVHLLPNRPALCTGPKCKLLSLRLSMVVLGVVCVVLGAVASRYHPHRPASDYCSCQDLSAGNGTGEWVCGNQTDALLGNWTISPRSFHYFSSLYFA